MPGPVAVAGAVAACSFGTAPAPIVVAPINLVTAGGPPLANVMDSKPTANVTPFLMCTSILNPTVAKATAEAGGTTIVPQPCVPVIPGPWTPGNPMVLIKGQPVVTVGCTCTCTYAGVITITSPGQATVIA